MTETVPMEEYLKRNMRTGPRSNGSSNDGICSDFTENDLDGFSSKDICDQTTGLEVHESVVHKRRNKRYDIENIRNISKGMNIRQVSDVLDSAGFEDFDGDETDMFDNELRYLETSNAIYGNTEILVSNGRGKTVATLSFDGREKLRNTVTFNKLRDFYVVPVEDGDLNDFYEYATGALDESVSSKKTGKYIPTDKYFDISKGTYNELCNDLKAEVVPYGNYSRIEGACPSVMYSKAALSHVMSRSVDMVVRVNLGVNLLRFDFVFERGGTCKYITINDLWLDKSGKIPGMPITIPSDMQDACNAVFMTITNEKPGAANDFYEEMSE